MIPYFEQPFLRLGPITIYAFGVIVATSVLIGFTLGGRRFRQLGLDARVGEQMAGYVVVTGFLVAHLFAVLLYFPRQVVADAFVVLRLWDHLSSFGGVLGGMLGVGLFFRTKGQSIDSAARWAYVDVAAFVFPISLAIGRLGCALAHDHPGTVTSFPLAVSLESDAARAYMTGVYSAAGRLAEFPVGSLARLGFHDLGLYEFLYLSAIVVPVTLMLAKESRAPGTFLISFIALYMPARFALDFLRVGDARYAGLTPAQWVAIAMLGTLPFLWLGRSRRRAAATTSLAVVLIPLGVSMACSFGS